MFDKFYNNCGNMMSMTNLRNVPLNHSNWVEFLRNVVSLEGSQMDPMKVQTTEMAKAHVIQLFMGFI